MSNPLPDLFRFINSMNSKRGSLPFGGDNTFWERFYFCLSWEWRPLPGAHTTSLNLLPGIQSSLKTLDDTLKGQDAKITDRAGDHRELSGRVETPGRKLRASIESARKGASDAASALISRVESRFAGQMDGVKTELATIKSAREGDEARIAALQHEFGQVRGEVRGELARQSNEVTAELNTLRGQVANDAARSIAATETQIAGLRQSQDRNRRDVDTLASGLAVGRLHFEATRFRNTEVAPGITLYVNKVDVPMHRISSWLWVLQDRRTIWIRGEGAQQPVEFYSTSDNKKRELVITGMTDNNVVGYVLVPHVAGPTQASVSAPASVVRRK